MVQWGAIQTTVTYTRITLPAVYTTRYTPLTCVVNNNGKNTLYDAHLPCVVSNIQLSYFERGSYANEIFYWSTIGY